MGATSSASFHDRYVLKDQLGKGSFGQVKSALSLKADRTPRHRAVKILDLVTDRDGAHAEPRVDSMLLREAQYEAKMWKKVGKHPHCIELLRTYLQGGSFFMVAERAEASVFDRLRDMWKLAEAGLVRVMREMMLGVAHVHARRIIHRDVKPDNFLLCGPQGTVKLCDFGLAVRLRRCGIRYLPGTVGTLPYMSPEMIQGKGHGCSTDIWSLGVTYYLLLYGEYPYQAKCNSALAMKAMKLAVLLGAPEPTFAQRYAIGRSHSHAMEAFARQMLERTPEQRWHAAEALSQPPLSTLARSATI